MYFNNSLFFKTMSIIFLFLNIKVFKIYADILNKIKYRNCEMLNGRK